MKKVKLTLSFFIQFFLSLGLKVEAFNILDTDLSNKTQEMIKSTNKEKNQLTNDGIGKLIAMSRAHIKQDFLWIWFFAKENFGMNEFF